MQTILLDLLCSNIEQLYRKLGLQLQLRARANPVSRGDFVTQCTSTTQSSQNLLFLLHPLIPNIYPFAKKEKRYGVKINLDLVYFDDCPVMGVCV